MKFTNRLRSVTILLGVTGMIAGCTKLPDYTATDEVHWLNQNWSPEVWNDFYHTPQGTKIMPYDWFVSLEQPTINLNPFGNNALFFETNYLARFGFLPSESTPINPDALPVGIVKDTAFVDPVTHQSQVIAGLTCAACHTGQLNIRDEQQKLIGLRVDGGAAMIDLQTFEGELGKAVVFTGKIPFRFDRFARRVLKENYNAKNKAVLKEEFNAFIDTGLKQNKLIKRLHIYPFQPGYGRVDALNRIANQVFGLQLDEANMHVADAPVAYPHIWETSWFDYVQYNSSVPNPLLRNIGESLGVMSPVVISGDPANWFSTASEVGNLYLMEQWLAGDAPYQGLKAPIWPEKYLGAIDAAKAKKGAELYGQYCVACHLPPSDQLEADFNSENPQYWIAKNTLGQRLLKVNHIDIHEIGTDPQQAQGFADRTVDTGVLGLGVINAGAALDFVTKNIALKYFRENNLSPEDQLKISSGHEVGAESAQVVTAYKARPLSGVWATPPFLHNGAVPTLYDLLSPVSERPNQFSLGSVLFDAKKVGYQIQSAKGLYTFDTTLKGNSHKGHEFNEGKGEGIIGPKLSEDERWQLVEYLKTL
ncbi:MAG: di-heme-cytochrome C peroxidase [Marinagarivorans sp.]|nr:di-heme-cytochrome C peroxidase [Marinagarivorans sp.]